MCVTHRGLLMFTQERGSRFSATEKPLRVRILIAYKGGRNGHGLHNLVEMT